MSRDRYTPSSMATLLGKAGIRLEDDRLQKLWSFHQLLRERNEELNMTRIFNFENMVRKHYVDSLIFLQFLKKEGLKLPDPLLDMGTGPGFPGIPLAIALPEQKFILAEGRQHRVGFLEEVKETLGLDNVTVFGRNIYSGTPLEAQGVITRAVETMDKTIQRLWGSLPDGGQVLFMKGPHCDEEIRLAQKNQEFPCDLLMDHKYDLPGSTDHRRLVVWSLRYPADFTGHLRTPVVIRTKIDSESNPRFKSMRGLHQVRNIKKQGQAIIQGKKIIQEFLRERADETEAFIVPRLEEYVTVAPDGESRLHPNIQDEYPALNTGKIEVLALAPALFKVLDEIKTGPPLLLCSVTDFPLWDPVAEADGPTLFLPLSDPENLGAALRTAAAFDIHRIVLLKECSHPFHPRAIRAAAGESFDLEILRGPSVSELAQSEISLYALDAGGENITNAELPDNFNLLVGQEGGGLPKEGNYKRLSIPISEMVESLNAGVALGVALYELKGRKGQD